MLTALAVPLVDRHYRRRVEADVGEAIGAAFPSGHATSSFALAASFAVLLAYLLFRAPAGLWLLLVWRS